MQLCKLTIVKETKKIAAAISSCHVVLIRSYTISSCTVTNDSKILGAYGGKIYCKQTCSKYLWYEANWKYNKPGLKTGVLSLMCVTDNKELVKKLMAFANEITMGKVAPLPLTVLKTIEVCKKCVFLRDFFFMYSNQ